MSCRRVRERLPDLLEGSLRGQARDVVASHLESCPDCSEEYRLLVTMRRLLSTHAAARAPVDFSHLAARCVARSMQARAAALLWLRRGLLTASATALFGLVAWHYTAQRPLSPQEPPTSRGLNGVGSRTPPQVVARDVADVEELHQAFAVQQSLAARDELLLFVPRWEESAR